MGNKKDIENYLFNFNKKISLKMNEIEKIKNY
ncbi:hypothetical protein N561_12090 [Gallibacterium anatis 12656/12]|uniref:Uncharacterized protein n=1 Tax=Gallibacterium anatis 12656/12 TaxID=1195244 RepID=U1GYR1_9PAST|nr:hypothetical protein N561_12090 [Gallibacterium anatis 12656/12]